MLCVVRWLNWYIYITHVFYYTDTLSLSGSQTTEIATRLLLLSFTFLGPKRDPHNEWISLHLVYDSTLSLSSSLWQPHNERGEFATLVVSPEEKPLKVWALTYWHSATTVLLSIPLPYMQWMNLKCDATTRPIKWILRLLHNVPPSPRPPEGTVPRDLHSDNVKW